jgi:hypothetical protein
MKVSYDEFMRGLKGGDATEEERIETLERDVKELNETMKELGRIFVRWYDDGERSL